LTVRKEVTGNATETKVRQVEGPERLQELAEMIGGQRITDTTRAQAQELLDAARGEFDANAAIAGRGSDEPKAGRNGRKVAARR
jgi:DNA repair protein RecN (Recombination protein N)